MPWMYVHDCYLYLYTVYTQWHVKTINNSPTHSLTNSHTMDSIKAMHSPTHSFLSSLLKASKGMQQVCIEKSPDRHLSIHPRWK